MKNIAGLAGQPYKNLREYIRYKSLNVSPEAIEKAIAEADKAALVPEGEEDEQ